MEEAMSKILALFSVLAIVSGLASCAPQEWKASGPCADCKYGVMSNDKSGSKRYFCVVDGKQVNCDKNEKACPGCAYKY